MLVDRPSLDRVKSDPHTFAPYFNAAAPQNSIASFTNLGGDAQLIAPSPIAPDSAYPHLAAFLRHAPKPQQQALWQAVSKAVEEQIGDRPLWLNTAGGGVAWLHVRLDSTPKYYQFAPYRRHPRR